MKRTWPVNWSKRTKTGFLWFPKSAKRPDNHFETRWLETATWEDEHFNGWWFCERWIDNPQTPAKEESEEGHTRIARFTLNHAGDAKDDKFKLELYPRIGDKPGKWPELKFTGTREAVWGFIGPEWDNDWKMPCDKTVNWLADWKLGREKTGEKAKPGSRYKDLIAIHGA